MAPDRRRARQEALVRALDAEGLDGLLVTSRANIRYLTGFSGSAARLAGEAVRRTLAQVRAGMTELAIAGLLEGALRQLGSEGQPFPTIVASGPRSALPHARSSRRIVATGEWLLLDFGAQVDGYCAPKSKRDRKSTRLNSSHQINSYAVFCLKKKSVVARHPPPGARAHE